MRLGLSAFRIISGKPLSKGNPAKCDLGKPPGLGSVVKVFEAFNEPMTSRQLAQATGLSIPVMSVITKFMRHYGDCVTEKGVHTRTGSTVLLDEFKARGARSNTGVTGVSFVRKTKVFTCCYGAISGLTFDNLLDAVCKRKSLELGLN